MLIANGVSTSVAQDVDLTGAWDSDLGPVIIAKTEAGYSGSYERGQSNILFSFNPEVGMYEGYWFEEHADRECARSSVGAGQSASNLTRYWGRIQFDAPQRRDHLRIRWGYCDDGLINRIWNFSLNEAADAHQSTHWLAYSNWIETTESDQQSSNSYVTVYPDRKWNCLRENNQGGCWYGLTGTPDAPLIYSRWQSGNLSKSNSAFEQIAANSYALSHRGRVQVNYQRVNNNRLVGYSQRPDGGTIRHTLRRVEKTVTAAASNSEYRTLGDSVTLNTNYKSLKHASSRGNRETINLYVYGENLWGRNFYHIAKQTGLEIWKVFYICAQRGSGPNQISYDDIGCLKNGGSVAGLSFEFVVWPNATSGHKVLKLNGQDVPFKLFVKNFPAPPQPEEETEFVITPLDQQHHSSSGFSRDYKYPYNRDGSVTGGFAHRILVLHGRHLPEINNFCLQSEDGHITYRRMTVPDRIRDRLHQTAHSIRGTTLLEGEAAVILRADLSVGIQPGIKGIRIEDKRVDWRLIFNDQRGAISFYRDRDLPLSGEAQVFYHNEVITAGIMSISNGLPLHGHRLKLSALSAASSDNNEQSRLRLLRKIPLRQVSLSEISGDSRNIAQTPPLLIQIQGQPPVATGSEILVTLRPGEKLHAEIIESYAFGAKPAVASVQAEPDDLNAWRRTLNQLKEICRKPGDPLTYAFLRDTSATVSHIMFTELQTRRINVTNGDHAALILIRNELVQAASKANEDFKAQYIDVSDPVRVASEYLAAAQQDAHSVNRPFWKYNTVSFDTPVPSGPAGNVKVSYRLSDFLNSGTIEELSGKVQKSIPDTKKLVNEKIARAIKYQYNQTESAIEKAENIGICNVEELLKVAGNRSSSIISAILPNLVKRENGRWIPNHTARRHVRTVYILGNAVKDQNAYAALDDSVFSSALALQGGLLSLGASVGSLFTTSTTMLANTARLTLALDALDVGVFGVRGVASAFSAESDYETAMGLAPVLGDDVVDDARRARSNPWLTMFSALTPTWSIGSGMAALSNISNINRGRDLLRTNSTITSIDGLNEADRVGLLAYHNHLNRLRFSGESVPDAADRVRLQNLLESSQAITRNEDAAQALNVIVRQSETPTNTRNNLLENNEAGRHVFSAQPSGQCQNLAPMTIRSNRAFQSSDSISWLREPDLNESRAWLRERRVTREQLDNIAGRIANEETVSVDEILDHVHAKILGPKEYEKLNIGQGIGSN